MATEHRPWFRIHRVDGPAGVVAAAAEDQDLDLGQDPDPEPDTHYRAFWTIEEKTYRVHIWNHDEWERNTPALSSAAEARSLNGRGWMLLQPIDPQ